MGHHHHPTLLWCIACACLFPGCFPMAGSRRPSVGVSIALRIFSAGRRWWVCIVVILWRCDGKGRRTAPCSQGAKAAAPEALLAGMAADGVIIPGMPHGQPRPCQQQAICSVWDAAFRAARSAYALSTAWCIGCASASPVPIHFLPTWRQLLTFSAASPPTHARWHCHWCDLPSACSTARACLSRVAPRVRALSRPSVTT